MIRYRVIYQQPNGKVDDATYLTSSPGQAFAACLKEHPDCILLEAEAKTWWGHWHSYKPPPIQRPIVKEPRMGPGSKPQKGESTMPFYDESKSKKSE